MRPLVTTKPASRVKPGQHPPGSLGASRAWSEGRAHINHQRMKSRWMNASPPAMLHAMNQTHTLSSGLVIRQDFAAAIRPVFFQTEFEEFLYATHGGTLFLVSFRGKTYGLTCRHVFQ